ncbi:MAG TPA: transposase [Burkholderiales bacterium]|jgi:transposase
MKLRRSRLTDEQSERLLEHFVAGTPARSAAALIGVNRNTARLFYHRLREIIAQRLAPTSSLQLDAVTAGGRRVAANRRAGARRRAIETPVFGLSVHHGKVIAVPVRAERSEAPPSAGTKARLDAIVFADLHAHRAALDVSSFRPRRVDESGRLARGRPRIAQVENFWSQAKRHLRRYNGIPREHLHLFLKECEWRFNYGPPAQLHKVLKAWIKVA